MNSARVLLSGNIILWLYPLDNFLMSLFLTSFAVNVLSLLNTCAAKPEVMAAASEVPEKFAWVLLLPAVSATPPKLEASTLFP